VKNLELVLGISGLSMLAPWGGGTDASPPSPPALKITFTGGFLEWARGGSMALMSHRKHRHRWYKILAGGSLSTVWLPPQIRRRGRARSQV
jgi:hypothetical protein